MVLILLVPFANFAVHSEAVKVLISVNNGLLKCVGHGVLFPPFSPASPPRASPALPGLSGRIIRAWDAVGVAVEVVEAAKMFMCCCADVLILNLFYVIVNTFIRIFKSFFKQQKPLEPCRFQRFSRGSFKL